MADFVLGDVFKKTCFFFPDNDRDDFKEEVGRSKTIVVNDKNGNKHAITFRVTRNVYLGEQHWIYGQVISCDDGVYRQIEIKIRNNKTQDTIEVFPQAPPLLL